MTLPIEWRPRRLPDLVRVGNEHDGGYVLPARSIAATDVVISLGICDDWSFEEDLCRRNPKARVIGYDPTITRNFWLKRVVSHVGAAVFRLEMRRLGRIFDWFRYKSFFDGTRAEHRSIRIGYDGEGSASIDKVLRSVPEGNVLLKVDIEGSEYRVLDQIVANARRLSCLVIEFHDVDIMRDRITSFLRSIEHDLIVCHIHANNCAGVDDRGDPIAVEITLVSKALVGTGEAVEFASLPAESLDRPNDLSRPEIVLTFGA